MFKLTIKNAVLALALIASVQCFAMDTSGQPAQTQTPVATISQPPAVVPQPAFCQMARQVAQKPGQKAPRVSALVKGLQAKYCN